MRLLFNRPRGATASAVGRCARLSRRRRVRDHPRRPRCLHPLPAQERRHDSADRPLSSVVEPAQPLHIARDAHHLEPARATGAPGPPGLRGPNGDTGPQGQPGPPGNDGAPGKDGTNGTDGTNGQDGVSATSAAEPAGPNYANGGSKFTASNGVTFACNGTVGGSGSAQVQTIRGGFGFILATAPFGPGFVFFGPATDVTVSGPGSHTIGAMATAVLEATLASTGFTMQYALYTQEQGGAITPMGNSALGHHDDIGFHDYPISGSVSKPAGHLRGGVLRIHAGQRRRRQCRRLGDRGRLMRRFDGPRGTEASR